MRGPVYRALHAGTRKGPEVRTQRDPGARGNVHPAGGAPAGDAGRRRLYTGAATITCLPRPSQAAIRAGSVSGPERPGGDQNVVSPIVRTPSGRTPSLFLVRPGPVPQVSREAPTPDLPRGAGGPLRRAAGRDSRPRRPAPAVALVLEPDPLARLLVEPAVAALGFAPVRVPAAAQPFAGEDPSVRAACPGCAARSDRAGPSGCGRSPGGVPAASAVFISVDAVDDCRRAVAAARRLVAPDCSVAPPPLVVAYGAGPAAVLAAHRAHRCADAVLMLRASAAGPCLDHPPAHDAVSGAGLSGREADVLVLLLRGLSTPAIADVLGVAHSTARSHCRAVLRKVGAGDRRALRALLLAGPTGAGTGRDAAREAPSCTPAGRFADARVSALPRNRA